MTTHTHLVRVRTAQDTAEQELCIRDGRVAGREGCARTPLDTIDGVGAIVTGGFVDVHTHSDLEAWSDASRDWKTREGVAYQLVGNCGYSFAPLSPAAADEVRASWDDIPDPAAVVPGGVAEYLDRVARRPVATRTAMLVGHHALVLTARSEVRREGEITRHVVASAERALDEGAVGVSLGLAYAPGRSRPRAELLALARTCAERDRPLAMHLRNEGRDVIASLREALGLAEDTGCRLHISHLKCGGRDAPRAETLLGLLAQARASGMRVTADAYPYRSSGTFLGGLLPEEVQRRAEVLADSATDPSAIEAFVSLARREQTMWAELEPETIVVTVHGSPSIAGRDLGTLARGWGVHPLVAACRVLVADRAAAVEFSWLRADDVDVIMESPDVVVASDSGLPGLSRHPRTYSTFSTFLRGYVRERGTVDLGEALRRVSAAAAEAFGLDAGSPDPGARADLVLLHPETLAVRATFVGGVAVYAEAAER